MKINNNRAGNGYLYFLALVIFALGALSTVYVYALVSSSGKNSLIQRTNTLAQLIEPAEISQLTGTQADLGNPVYLSLKERLQRAALANPDTKFIYITGEKNNSIFFFVDSEPPTSADYSPPGQVYFEASTLFRDVFAKKQAVLEGPFQDRWGTWLSALTPVFARGSGEVIAVVGIDIDATTYRQSLIAYSSIPALITLFLLLLLSIYFAMRQRELKRLAVKAELISIASHEIRSPLNGIIWSARGLIKSTSGKLVKNQAETLKLIYLSCENLLRTVNDLLDLYALDNTRQKISKSQVDVLPVLKDILQNSELSAREKKVKLHLAASVQQVVILADKDKLRRMFNNLVSNAIKYSRPNGGVTVDCKEQGKNFTFSVSDGGIGIPKEDHEKIFQGFFRSLNARDVVSQGTGLGLYYVQQVVKAHNGSIWFESEVGKGTTFFVTLPK